MLGQKKQLITETTENQPVVLLLTEKNNPFTRRLTDFFNSNNLNTKHLLLSSFVDPDQALIQYQNIKKSEVYKLVVVGGFYSNFIEKPDFLLQVLHALERGFVEEGRFLSSFFLLNYSSEINSIDLKLDNYQLFWSRQNSFLNSALKMFPLSQFCLVEDYIDLEFDFSLNFNLYFSLFKQHLLLDNQEECYWQGKEGFFKHFKKIFFQSKAGDKFLLRGQKTPTTTFLQNAQDLCNRYFVEKFNIVQFFFKLTGNKALLADFVKMHYVDESVINILDQKIRRLPLSLDLDLNVIPKDLLALETQKSTSPMIIETEVQKQFKTPEETKLEPVETKVIAPAKEQKAALANKKIVKEEIIKKKKIKLIDKKIDESSDIDKKLQDIFRSEQKDRQEERFTKNLKGAHKIVKKSKYRRLSFYLGILLTTLGFLVLILFTSFYLSQKIFEKDLLTFMEKKLSKPTIENSDINITESRFFKWQLDNYQKIVGQDLLSTPLNYWQIFTQINQQQKLNQELEKKAFLLFQEILNTDGDPETEWSEFLTINKEFFQQQQELNSQLDQLNLDILSDNKAKIIADYRAQLIKESRIQQRAYLFFEALSQLLLSPARSNIVVLIQDSSELRSSGGFLVSIVTLSFEKSRLLNWQVYDVANLDERIYGDRLANEQLRKLLVADRLLLRDANWPVNFADAGADIDWFIEQSLSLTPDLIISLNSKDLVTFAAPLFPIVVNNFSLEQNNYFEELLRQENFNFTDFSKAFVDRLLSVSQDEFKHVFNELVLTLETRESLIFSRDEKIQSVLQNNLWSGNLLNTPCPSDFTKNNESCFTDGIYQLENNVGLNKVNRLITQEVSHSLGISENFIRHKRSITFTNLSRQNFWPEGNYQNYLKFYLPKTARLEKFSLDGIAVDPAVYNLFEENNRQVLAYKFTVPILSSSKLELVYLVPHQLTLPFSYVFLDQKQPGIFNKTTNYKVMFAESFQPKLIAPQASYEDKVIEFTNNNLDNFLFAVAF